MKSKKQQRNDRGDRTTELTANSKPQQTLQKMNTKHQKTQIPITNKEVKESSSTKWQRVLFKHQNVEKTNSYIKTQNSPNNPDKTIQWKQADIQQYNPTEPATSSFIQLQQPINTLTSHQQHLQQPINTLMPHQSSLNTFIPHIHHLQPPPYGLISLEELY